MAETKVTTVRLPKEVAEDLAALAEVKGTSVNQEVRLAVEDRLAAAKADPVLHDSVRRALKKHAALLRRLAST